MVRIIERRRAAIEGPSSKLQLGEAICQISFENYADTFRSRRPGRAKVELVPPFVLGLWRQRYLPLPDLPMR